MYYSYILTAPHKPEILKTVSSKSHVTVYFQKPASYPPTGELSSLEIHFQSEIIVEIDFEEDCVEYQYCSKGIEIPYNNYLNGKELQFQVRPYHFYHNE